MTPSVDRVLAMLPCRKPFGRNRPARGSAVHGAATLFFALPWKRERDKRVGYRVVARMASTEAVAVCGRAAIRHISAERVQDKLASVRKVGYRTRRRAPGVCHIRRSIERKQRVASPGIAARKCSFPLTKRSDEKAHPPSLGTRRILPT